MKFKAVPKETKEKIYQKERGEKTRKETETKAREKSKSKRLTDVTRQRSSCSHREPWGGPFLFSCRQAVVQLLL